MRNKKLGILCTQETHLNQDHLSQIETLFLRRLPIFNTSDPTCPGSSIGIAFVLNKELVDTLKAEMNVIIPGRTAVFTLKWHNEQIIKIINIYTPNSPSEHQAFWLKIGSEWLKLNIRKPNFMLGDFNITEDPIDQAPARLDNENAIGALRDLRNTLKLQDTWRIEHPNERKFTFSSNHQTMSCLNRIYTSDQLANSLLDWDSHVSPIITDHHIVSVHYTPPGLPHIGKGRWSWPPSLLTDTNLLKQIINIGMTAQTKIENLTSRTADMNPQLIWCTFKDDISNLAKETARTHLNKINQRIKTLLKDLQKTMNSQNIDTSQDAQINNILIEREINHLQKKQQQKTNLNAQAQWATYGEMVSKYWLKVKSNKSPRDVLYHLNIPNTNRYTTKSEEMAKIAKTYHEAIQNIDMTPESNNARQEVRENILTEIPQSQKLDTPPEQMDTLLIEEQILTALLSSKSGSAPSIDGIPYDTWKLLHYKHIETQKNGKPSFNITKTLTMVMTDIQLHGLTPNSTFTTGWMCPIYKKKDCTKIENYRPITLLNTDYKTLTKALAIQLVRTAHKLIHPNQSGFIPK